MAVYSAGGSIGGHAAADLLRPGHRSVRGVDIVEEIAGIKRKDSGDLKPLEGVNDRGRDNMLLRHNRGWEPDTRLPAGAEKA